MILILSVWASAKVLLIWVLKCWGQNVARKIAVEIKSFSGLSDVDDFEDALGEFLLYKLALTKKEPDRVLFLAMPVDIHAGLFDDSFFVEVLKTYHVQLIVYDFKQVNIEQWIRL